jgi:hypothetical protein
MAYIMIGTVDPRDQLAFELADKCKSWSAVRRVRGSHIDTTGLCASATSYSSITNLPPLFWVAPRYGVREDLKVRIESLEPGVHQFIPLTVTLKNGGPALEESYLLQIGSRVDAIDGERSVARFDSGAYWLDGFPPGTAKLVLRREPIAGRAIWWDEKLTNPFVSNELHDVMVEIGVRAVVFERVDEL